MFTLHGKYNYEILREIGCGGFGTVYLAKSGGEYFAVKKIYNASENSHEMKALRLYCDALNKKNVGGVIAIIEIFFDKNCAYYTMPLGDGTDKNLSPEDERWEALTLQKLVEKRRGAPQWFSKKEILDIMIPLAGAVENLSRRGLVHRDIKPANIVFLHGKPCLVDIGLVTQDAASMSMVGTPDFSAPSWYLKSHGNPDMWGLALTLYFFATGNNPDMLGRAAFSFPKCVDAKPSKSDETAREHFYRVVLRATQEKPKDRYRNLADFAADLQKVRGFPIFRRTYIKVMAAAITLSALGVVGGLIYQKRKPWGFGGESAERQWILEMTEKAQSLIYKQNPSHEELSLAFAIMDIAQKKSTLADKTPEFLETHIYICLLYGFFQRILDDYEKYKQCSADRRIPDALWGYVMKACARLGNYDMAEKALAEMLEYLDKKNLVAKYKHSQIRFVSRATIIKDPLMMETIHNDFLDTIVVFNKERKIGAKILEKTRGEITENEVKFLKNLKSDTAAISLVMDKITKDAPEFYEWVGKHHAETKTLIDLWGNAVQGNNH